MPPRPPTRRGQSPPETPGHDGLIGQPAVQLLQAARTRAARSSARRWRARSGTEAEPPPGTGGPRRAAARPVDIHSCPVAPASAASRAATAARAASHDETAAGRTVVGTAPSAQAGAGRRRACRAACGWGTSTARPGRSGPPRRRTARPRCPGRYPRRRRHRCRGRTTRRGRPARRAARPTASSGAKASTSDVDHMAFEGSQGVRRSSVVGVGNTSRDGEGSLSSGPEIAESVLDLIGNTPLVKLRPARRRTCRLHARGQDGDHQPRGLVEGPPRGRDDRRRRAGRPARARAARSSSRRRATPASGWPSSPRSGATGACSS